MVLGDAVSKLETFVWILNHISKTITWSLFTLKASYLVNWPMLTWSFMWWCQFIDKLKFETRPSPLLNFGKANIAHWQGMKTYCRSWASCGFNDRNATLQVDFFTTSTTLELELFSCVLFHRTKFEFSFFFTVSVLDYLNYC